MSIFPAEVPVFFFFFFFLQSIPAVLSLDFFPLLSILYVACYAEANAEVDPFTSPKI